jgi:signal peptidase I
MTQETPQNSPEQQAETIEAVQQPVDLQVTDLQIADPQLVDLQPGTPEGQTAYRRSSDWKLWTRDLLFSALASVLIITFLYQPVRVEGTSMLPRLVDQDRLFINKFVYRFSAIEHGDVVVFRYPLDHQKSYIKRIIAVPGDRLRIDRGQVFVNDRPLSEPYIPEEYRDTRSLEAMVVPKDEYFVMGDHRSISSDSREFGPVKRELIYGKAAFVYWPTRDVGVVH